MKRHVYKAKQPDSKGYIDYSEQENATWNELYKRQMPIVESRACQAYLDGLEALGLNEHRIPQCKEVSERLQKLTGWSVAPVEALISFEEFYNLLANKTFPAASFIRIPEHLDYLPEPDIFHEVFGHCPALTDPDFANFTQAFGKIGLKADPKDRARLARLYWFTAEFGLIDTPQGSRVYGAGILSSKSETIYALESNIPERRPFNMLEALRMPYRYDIMQTLYYVIKDFRTLFEMVEQDLLSLLAEAKSLGNLDRELREPQELEELEDIRSC
jgi:phenylalanine-4-hydroxylase